MKPFTENPLWLSLSQRKHSLAILGATILILTALAGWLLRPQPVLVVVEESGQTTEFVTKRKSLGAALEHQGITVGPNDYLSMDLEASLKGLAEVRLTIRRAVPIALVVGGEQQEVESSAASVGELLEEMEIKLGTKDTVTPDLSQPLTHGLQVKVVRRSEERQVSQVSIPYDLVRRDDRTMAIGQTKELQEGAPGLMEVTELVIIEDGQEVSRELLEEHVIQEPISQVVAYGTLGVVSRGGTEYRYTRELVMEATGYTAGKESNPNGNGYTYTGMKAVRGVVAVDPRVIPLYTRVYVEGYGPAIAADIGGAIKGNKIDLCFETVEEALQWGRRPARVYILSE